MAIQLENIVEYDYQTQTGDTGSTSKNKINGNNTKIVEELSRIDSAKVEKTTKVNNKPLSSDITLNKNDIGLNNVDNTADVDKPVSNAQQTIFNTKTDKTTQVIAGNGLTGGGTLESDRTINVGATDDSIVVAADGIKADTQNSLTSTSTTKPLAANQGKILDGKITQLSADLNPIINNRNLFKNSRLLFFDKIGNNFSIRPMAGTTPTCTIEDSQFATKQLRIIAKIGDRGQLTSNLTIKTGEIYSAGFFYKIISGSKKPFIYDFNTSTSGALTTGILKEITLSDGWVFYARENCSASASGNYPNAFIIDFNNTGGTEQCEVLIAMPSMIIGNSISASRLQGYDFAFQYINDKFLSLDNDIAFVSGKNWNIYADSGMFLVDKLGDSGIRTSPQTGTPTFTFEKNIFGGQQTRIVAKIGDRAQIISPFNVETDIHYSFGFFYKVISGNKEPIVSEYMLSRISGNVSTGTYSVVDVQDGWKFFKRENFYYNISSSNANGLYIDFNNVTGTDKCEVLIALPILIKNTTITPSYQNSTFDAIINLFNRVLIMESKISASLVSDWKDKNIALYGDSITAISNGDFAKPYIDLTKWGTIIADYFSFSNIYGRGAGGQKYAWGDNGGAVVFVNQTTGNYDSRNDSYNYDNYTGEIPADCIKTRGTFSSWHRITSMFPASIKDTIHCIIIKGGTNDAVDASDLSWVSNSNIDVEWSSSAYYTIYGGDFNINTLKGGIASTIMKMQAWMPQAIIIIATPLPGRGTTGQINLVPVTDEYTKSIYVRDVAKIFSIPIIDVNANSGINGLNRTTYISDGVHPYSLTGNKMLARTIIGGLKGINPKL